MTNKKLHKMVDSITKMHKPLTEGAEYWYRRGIEDGIVNYKEYINMRNAWGSLAVTLAIGAVLYVNTVHEIKKHQKEKNESESYEEYNEEEEEA